MRNFAFCSLCLCFLVACNKDNCHPESFAHSLFENKSLDTATYDWPGGGVPFFGTRISGGQTTVVRHARFYGHCDSHADQTYETVMFEVPPNTASFSFSDSASLRGAKAIFSLWPTGSEEAYFITHGNIEGTKRSDGTWQIKASLLSPGNGERITFNKRFEAVR